MFIHRRFFFENLQTKPRIRHKYHIFAVWQFFENMLFEKFEQTTLSDFQIFNRTNDSF